MNGTTLCPYCETRFKIANAQLTAHNGMVRCGHCHQAFDARPNFFPEPLDLSIGEVLVEESDAAEHHEIDDSDTAEAPEQQIATDPAPDTITEPARSDAQQPRTEPDNTLDFSRKHVVADDQEHNGLAEFILNEERYHSSPAFSIGAATQDEIGITTRHDHHTWIWLSGILLGAMLLTGQSVYFFRIGLAAHIPAMKPALSTFCNLLHCSVPLPENAELISIESSSLDTDPELKNQVTLNALLRSRASYTLAFPALSLTLNDSQNKPVARRIFLPGEYLPSDESKSAGFPVNHETGIKINLHFDNLKPVGYQLELFYPQ